MGFESCNALDAKVAPKRTTQCQAKVCSASCVFNFRYIIFVIVLSPLLLGDGRR